MADRYKSMRSLRDDLAKLCELCGLETTTTSIPKASRMVDFAETITRDDSMYRFLLSLRSQVRQATKLLEDKQLDYWNSEQNAQDLDALEEETEHLKKELEAARADAAQAKARASMLETELELLRADLEALQPPQMPEDADLESDAIRFPGDSTTEENDRGGFAPGDEIAWPGEEAGAEEEAFPEWIRSIIAMRDHLQASLEWALGSDPVNADVVKILNGQLRETADLLTAAGVEIWDAARVPFDPERHAVVGAVPTTEEELVGTVERTFRPGYARFGEVLRGQEVFLYE